jgi:hypothetical protein
MNIHDLAKQIRSFADELEATKPEQPKPFTLPTPPPGMRWHREDEWTADMLPPSTRPLVLAEKRQNEDQIFGFFYTEGDIWKNYGDQNQYKDTSAEENSLPTRTTRPLLFTHSGHEWTWHRAGDPCPCDGAREVVTLLEDLSIGGTIRAGRFDWGERDDGEQIIGWRYAEKPDPYAELKKAHAEGKKIEGLIGGYWLPAPHPKWKYPVETYRVAESKLPETCNVPRAKPDEIPWTEWHGGECPLKDEEVELAEVRFRGTPDTPDETDKPECLRWSHNILDGDIIAYRVLKTREPKPKVPLGPEDVPPGSVFRLHDADIGYEVPCEVSQEGVTFADDTGNFTKTWEELRHWQINRPRHRDSDGNPTKWEACEK